MPALTEKIAALETMLADTEDRCDELRDTNRVLQATIADIDQGVHISSIRARLDSMDARLFGVFDEISGRLDTIGQVVTALVQRDEICKEVLELRGTIEKQYQQMVRLQDELRCKGAE